MLGKKTNTKKKLPAITKPVLKSLDCDLVVLNLSYEHVLWVKDNHGFQSIQHKHLLFNDRGKTRTICK